MLWKKWLITFKSFMHSLFPFNTKTKVIKCRKCIERKTSYRVRNNSKTTIKAPFRPLLPVAGGSSSSSRTPRKMASLARSLRLAGRVRASTVLAIVPRAATVGCLHSLSVRDHSASSRVPGPALKVRGGGGQAAGMCLHLGISWWQTGQGPRGLPGPWPPRRAAQAGGWGCLGVSPKVHPGHCGGHPSAAWSTLCTSPRYFAIWTTRLWDNDFSKFGLRGICWGIYFHLLHFCISSGHVWLVYILSSYVWSG